MCFFSGGYRRSGILERFFTWAVMGDLRINGLRWSYNLFNSGAPAARNGAPYPYRKQEETHEFIFSWLSWLAVLLWVRTHDGWDTDGNERVAQHGGHNLNNKLTKTCSLDLQFVSLILDIHAMINWPRSKQGICCLVSCEHIMGSSLQLVKVTCYLQ